MALKLRRGTSTTRTNYTFAEGELVYTTDTKKLYVGDGTTPGGTLVTGSGGSGVEINGITDNTTEGTVVMTLGDALISLDTAVSLGGDLDITNYQIDGDGDINITGDITASGSGTGIITANSFVGDGSGLTGIPGGSGPFVGDLTGSVFADDSTLVVDGISGNVTTNVLTVNSITRSAANLRITGDDKTSLFVDSTNANTSNLTFTRNGSVDISGDAVAQGEIIFERNDPVNGSRTTASIRGFENLISFALYPFTSDYFMSFEGGKLAIGDLTPTEKLHVDGNAIITGTLTADTVIANAAGTPELESASDIVLTVAGRVEVAGGPFKAAGLTTVQRDALTAENGDIIYNTTDNKFQGYENGSWANLI
jgi:hypothetical protein